MNLTDFKFGLNPGTLAVGAAALFLGPIVLPAARNAARAVAKSGMKGGMKVYSSGRQYVADTGNYFKDIASEARKEAAKELKSK